MTTGKEAIEQERRRQIAFKRKVRIAWAVVIIVTVVLMVDHYLL